MSLSIVVDGQLWGLVVGHHRRPWRVSLPRRHQALALTVALATQIGAIEKKMEIAARANQISLHATLLEQLVDAESSLEPLTFLAKSVDLGGLFPGADGAAVVFADGGARYSAAKVIQAGTTPSKPDIVALAKAIRPLFQDGVFATNHCASLHPEIAARSPSAAGVLAIDIVDGGHKIVMWFRPETVSTTVWGGATPEHVENEKQAGNTLPRQSFERWEVERRGYAEAWPKWVIEIAGALKNAIDHVAARNTYVRLTDQNTALAQKVAETQRMAALVYDNSSDAMFVADSDNKIIDVNPSFVVITGLQRDEVIGQNPRILASGAHDSDFYKRMWESILKNGQWHGEIQNRRKSGEIYSERLQIQTVRGNDGKIERYVAIFTDISEYKLREAQLSEARVKAETLASDLAKRNHFIRTITDNIPGMIGYWNKDLQCRFANPAYEWWFGVKPEQMIDRHIKDLLGEEFFQKNKVFIDQVLAGRAQTFENEIIRPDGSYGYTLASYIPDTDKDGAVCGFFVLGSDVTDLKKAEQSAKEASRIKSEFLANMSHEIRTPLNGIVGFTHLALLEGPQQKIREYIECIDISSQRLLNVVNSILDYSKLNAKQLAVESIPFALNDVILMAQTVVLPNVKAKGLDLRVAVAPSVPNLLLGDPDRIGQILLNYLSNAVKFTEQGQIDISVSMEKVRDDVATLRIAVTDTGMGIAEDQLGKLFQSFHQADGSMTRKFGGTGLGLAISRELAHLMGGEAGVESRYGEGSTFWFTAKVGISPAEDAVPEGPGPRSTAQSIADMALIKGTRLLLVEDDPVNQAVATGLLQAAGILVDVASNGAIAIQMLRAKDYEIVLMDMQMPVMDGLAATRQIRKDARFSDLPIVAMTANALDVHQAACLEAGMNAFISKPLKPAEFYSTILTWVTGAADMALFDPSFVADGAADIRVPSTIGGLDVRAGLRRVAGMKGVYVTTLRSFAEQQAGVSDRIRTAIGKNDIKTASREAHTLKGGAGAIEAVDVMHLAARIEAAFNDNAVEDGVALLGQLDAILMPLITSILAATEPMENTCGGLGTAPHSDNCFDFDAVAVAAAQLDELMANGDTRSLDVASELMTLLAGTAFISICEDLGQHLTIFDFIRAKSTLETLLAAVFGDKGHAS